MMDFSNSGDIRRLAGIPQEMGSVATLVIDTVIIIVLILI